MLIVSFITDHGQPKKRIKTRRRRQCFELYVCNAQQDEWCIGIIVCDPDYGELRRHPAKILRGAG